VGLKIRVKNVGFCTEATFNSLGQMRETGNIGCIISEKS
jgi:hypothetical protein